MHSCQRYFQAFLCERGINNGKNLIYVTLTFSSFSVTEFSVGNLRYS